MQRLTYIPTWWCRSFRRDSLPPHGWRGTRGWPTQAGTSPGSPTGSAALSVDSSGSKTPARPCCREDTLHSMILIGIKFTFWIWIRIRFWSEMGQMMVKSILSELVEKHRLEQWRLFVTENNIDFSYVTYAKNNEKLDADGAVLFL